MQGQSLARSDRGHYRLILPYHCFSASRLTRFYWILLPPPFIARQRRVYCGIDLHLRPDQAYAVKCQVTQTALPRVLNSKFRVR